MVHKHVSGLAESFEGREKDLVMLSPDATVTLERLEKGKVYVIGGIVDRTVVKGVTLGKAEEVRVPPLIVDMPFGPGWFHMSTWPRRWALLLIVRKAAVAACGFFVWRCTSSIQGAGAGAGTIYFQSPSCELPASSAKKAVIGNTNATFRQGENA